MGRWEWTSLELPSRALAQSPAQGSLTNYASRHTYATHHCKESMLKEAERDIEGFAKTVGEILEKKKYTIDYYQRGYKWESKQMSELVSDLTSKFLQIHSPEHDRWDVGKYSGYFLGSIIISQKGHQPFIVDGQQRLTSLTLFLIYLRRLQLDREDRVDVDSLIFSEKYGKKSFNLDIPDRDECMHALYDDGNYDPPPDSDDSVQTLTARFNELDALFPDELKGDALPYFVDWLKDRVQLVQITAYNDEDAYAIFETMNDRGLNLTPADMLKGYLLANMPEGDARQKAATVWRDRIRALDEFAEESSADFLKTWLRSQYATKIRERRKGARPEDWDKIGTEFHRWVRTEHQRLGLDSKQAYYSFIVSDFDFYSRQYERVQHAAKGPFDPGSPLRFIRYNSDHGFTLQDQLLLAPLTTGDDKGTVNLKLEIVARFIDILLARRIWNFRSTAYSTMQYAMFVVLRGIRGLDPAPLAHWLINYLNKQAETFASVDELYMHQQNRGQLHKILARITDFVTVESGQASNYIELTNGANVRYEVEHIWADHYERHTEEFSQSADFDRHRNRIGDLLLLPKRFNASYSDDPYEKKLQHYFGQNLLAASLSELSYDRNPGFLEFVRRSQLPFKSYDTFKAADIIERGRLYRALAEELWNPDDLRAVADRANN